MNTYFQGLAADAAARHFFGPLEGRRKRRRAWKKAHKMLVQRGLVVYVHDEILVTGAAAQQVMRRRSVRTPVLWSFDEAHVFKDRAAFQTASLALREWFRKEKP